MNAASWLQVQVHAAAISPSSQPLGIGPFLWGNCGACANVPRGFYPSSYVFPAGVPAGLGAPPPLQHRRMRGEEEESSAAPGFAVEVGDDALQTAALQPTVSCRWLVMGQHSTEKRQLSAIRLAICPVEDSPRDTEATETAATTDTDAESWLFVLFTFDFLEVSSSPSPPPHHPPPTQHHLSNLASLAPQPLAALSSSACLLPPSFPLASSFSFPP